MVEEKVRLARLLFVESRIADGSYPNAAELARDYECSHRTVKRDIEYLRDMHGAPIEYDPARRGYYLSEPTWRLGALPISESELFALTLAASALDGYRNSPLHAELTRIFSRLASLLPETVSIPASWLGDQFSVFHGPVSRIDGATWRPILKALRDRRSVHLTYRPPSRPEPLERVVDPYHCVSLHGEWYLLGYDHDRSALRTYALSRIVAVRVTERRFALPRDFDPADHVDPAFGIHIGGKTHSVLIRFAPDLAPIIREREWHPTQEVRTRSDGSLDLEFRTNQLDAVRRWVRSLGPGAVVVRPPELRAAIRDELERALAAYPAANPTARIGPDR